jgi:hypothetical protein
MRHHLIKPDIPCPNCGQPGLRYVGSWPTGDKYTCPACQHTAVHMSNGKRAEGRGCVLRTSIKSCQYGPALPCGAAKGE